MNKKAESNQVLQAIAERYSCRAYTEEIPTEEILEKIVTAATMAPSARNRQPWRIILIKDQKLLTELEEESMVHLSQMEDKTLYNNIMNRGGAIFYHAPVMIMVAIDPTLKYSQIDCGIVCQNIALATTSLGLGNVICGLAGLAFSDDSKGKQLMKRLKFPEGYEFGCSVLLGYEKSGGQAHEPAKDKVIVIDK